MTAANIAAALGAASRSGKWWRCVFPVHGSRHGKSAALALCDGDRGGLIVHCHAGCARGDIIAELAQRGLIDISPRTRGGTHRHLTRSAAIEPRCGSDAELIAVLPRKWDRMQSADAGGSPVPLYLASRGITIAPPPTLRWAPALRRLDGTYATAMVGLVEHVDHGVVGLHRTWIAADANGTWRRTDRAGLGQVGGGAVRLSPAAETLMIGEGIETCLSAVQATGLPAWAALSAGGIVALRLPDMVRSIIVLADNDLNGVGQRAAQKAAQRWIAEGRRVRIALPLVPGMDMADVLVAGCSVPTEVHDVAA